MKTILALLLAFSSYGQTKSEALQFLRENIGIWSIERLAEGTLNNRLEFSLDDSFLVIKENFPASSFAEYGIVKIDLSSIKRVEAEGGQVVRIVTSEGGLVLIGKGRDSHSSVIYDAAEYAKTNGWTYDGIRLKNHDDLELRMERTIKALEFLAVDGGATLSNSKF